MTSYSRDGSSTTSAGYEHPDPGPNPGFRVTADHLSDAAAWDAMHKAASALVGAALDARLDLLRLGFADTHTLTRELDATAAQYAVVIEAIRRQRAAS